MRFVTFLLALLTIAAPARAQAIATEADGTRTMIHEGWAAATPAAIWPIISTAPGWASWAVPNAWQTGDLLETSYTPGAKQGDPANIQQRFVAALPGRLLVFRTIRTPPAFPHAAAFMQVTHFLELVPQDGGTLIRLTGTGYPTGTEGTELLGFFGAGNRFTLDALAARVGLMPLDFLVGHCWRGNLPNGDLNNHCFDRFEGKVRDRHEVLRAGVKVYGGETLYAWDAAAKLARYTYTGMDGGVMKGSFRPDGADLDFGTADYVGDTATVTIATRWVRVAPNAYEARDTSPSGAHFNRTTRYTRVD